MAFQEGVIDEAVLKSLSALYDRRNDIMLNAALHRTIIHKVFLTPITYESLADDLLQYE